jgi:hypothetical protein
MYRLGIVSKQLLIIPLYKFRRRCSCLVCTFNSFQSLYHRVSPFMPIFSALQHRGPTNTSIVEASQSFRPSKRYNL